MATSYRIRKMWEGLTEKQVRENFPTFKTMPRGTANTKVDNNWETLADGTKVKTGYILERITTRAEAEEGSE